MATSTLGSGTLVLAGTTSGTTTVTATAVAGTTTLTLPAATDTLVGKATTDTLTNKTLTGAAMNGTLGATTPSTVAATTLTTSSTVTHNGGTANGVAYLDGSKVLTTGSALVFDASGNLGLGTSSPTANTGTSLVLYHSATPRIRLTNSTTGTAASDGGEISIFNSDLAIENREAANIIFYNGGSERARFNSTGAFVLAGGTTTANGIGITFPATQSASSDANTLDDYEEGTCNLSLTFGGASVGITYANQLFVYTKIGRQVTITGELQLLNKGSSTGTALITGLPFPSISGQGGYASGGVSYTLGFSITGILGMVALPNTSTIGFNILNNGSISALTNSNFTNTSDILFTVSYFTT